MRVIWCHGGCFGGGSRKYDKPARDMLTKNGYDVINPDFPTDKGMDAAVDHILTCASTEAKDDIVIIGVSSGGLIAHNVANQIGCPAVLIAPVGNPFSRHKTLIKKQQDLQLRFFGTLDNMESEELNLSLPNNERFIICGSDDHRASSKPWMGLHNVDHRHISIMFMPGGHEICKKPPMDTILDFIKHCKRARRRLKRETRHRNQEE